MKVPGVGKGDGGNGVTNYATNIIITKYLYLWVDSQNCRGFYWATA